MLFASPKDALDSGIRVIHQEINMAPALSVAENIFLGNYAMKSKYGIDWKKMEAEAERLLNKLGVSFSVTQKTGNLSIAQQQMVEIAKALSVNPKVLIMDEPTAALNDQETDALFDVIRNLKAHGVAIIYITHRFAELYRLVDCVTIMRNGKTIGTFNIEDVTDDMLVKMMVNDDQKAIFSRTRLEQGEELFRVENICIEDTCSDLSLTVHKNEFVVIFGLVGAGQTEFMKGLFGDIPISSGKIFINGKEVHIKNIKDACKNGIGYVSDDRKNEGLIPLQSVQEYICLTAYDSLLSNKLGIIDYSAASSTAKHFFDQLRIRCKSIDQQIGSLSGGNQQKGMFCRWLANDAKVLLLNMPTRGVDVGARAEIYKTMESLSESGCAILTVSLEIPEVLSIADTVYVMHEGKIVSVLKGGQITQENLMRGALGIQSEQQGKEE